MSGAYNYFHTYDGQGVRERTLLEIAFNHSPLPKALVNRDGKFLEVNPAFCQYIGYAKDELCSLDFRAISHPDDLPLSKTFWEQLLQGSISSFQVEKRYIHKGGATLWGQLHIATVAQDSEPLSFYIAQIVDITENKAAEDSLRRLKSFYDNSSEGIAIFDLDGHAIQVNAAYQKFIGFREEELIGKRIPFNPANATSDAVTVFSEQMKGNYVQNFETSVVHKDGTPIWVSLTTSPVHSDDGSVVGMAIIARNITKRKLAEHKLSETIKLQNIILENSTDIISYCSTDGTCLYISPAVQTSLGYDPSEVMGTLAKQYLHPDDVDRVVQTFVRLLSADSRETCFTARLHHKNGNYRWYETKAKLHRDESNVSAVVAVSRDVSEEIRLQESLEDAVRIARLGHWDWDLLKDRVVHSPQAYEILGLKQDGSVIDYEHFLHMVHAEDRALVDQSIRRSIDTGMQFDRIFRIVLPDETVRYLHSQGEVMFDDDGGAVRMIGSFQDITARHLLEQQLVDTRERYQLLVESSLDGIGVVEEGKWTYLNKAGMALFGASTAEQVVGQEVLDFLHPDHHEQYVSRLQAMLSGESLRMTEQRFLKLNGEAFYAELVTTAMGGNKIQVVLRDVTERKQTDEILIRSEKLSAVGQLAAGIVHEVRNPLTALKGFTQILYTESRDPNRSYFTIMLGELDRIEMILSEMLMLAKPQAVTYRPHDIELVLEEVITLVTPQAVMKSVSLELEFAEGVRTVLCDPNQLKQVFINVIKNAIEAMSSGGTVKITGATLDGKLQIDFVDEGEGIPEDRLPKLGEPFFTTKERGTGLGLMVSHRIVTAHGGTLDISSRVGVGTTVRIVLPLHREPESEGLQP